MANEAFFNLMCFDVFLYTRKRLHLLKKTAKKRIMVPKICDSRNEAFLPEMKLFITAVRRHVHENM